MTILIKGSSQNQALESSSVEVKFLTLALHFSLLLYVFICVYVFVICLFSLGLLCVCV